MSAPSKIDRLIELGLSRYGAGDLEGALLMWEEALAIDPSNTQASSYVDYVRLHVELLGSEPAVAAPEEAPFGIEIEPEYQIEVSPGQLPARESQPVLAPDGLDGGWFEDEVATHSATSRATTVPYDGEEPPPLELAAEEPSALDIEPEIQIEQPPLELDADQPSLELDADPPSLELEADLPPLPEVSFDLATREYYGTPTAPVLGAELSDFADVGTQGGTREYLGRRDPASPAATRPGEGSPADFAHDEYTGGFTSEGSSLGFSRQETEIRKRDLGFVQPLASEETGEKPTQDGSSSDHAQTMERASFADSTPAASDPDEDELLATLPNPRRPHPQLDLSQETQDIPVLPTTKAITKELPDAQRRPATRETADVSPAEMMVANAKTHDFRVRIDISAPTRDLGIRPPPQSKSDVDDEAVTKQSDVRAIRDAAARKEGGAIAAPAPAPAEPDPEGTHSDVALAFDPIDARTAEILEEIDASAPANEPRDDQTRRRIAALLERAVQWNAIGETEKAVAAVDLAMSEDPNSALGQKLITRNRDTITNVFQGYLADLERMPQLARPLHELQGAPISPRAAFLLSRIDGTLTIDELLDVSGMSRVEALRHLCQLYLRGILR